MQKNSLRRLAITLGFLCLIGAPEFGMSASSWNPTLIVNTEASQIIDGADTAANLMLKFGDTLSAEITYDRTNSKFVFSKPVVVQGNLSGSSLRVTGNADVHGVLSASGAVHFDSNLSINDDQTAADAVLTFGNSILNQTLTYMATAQKFRFSKDVSVLGNLSGSTLTVDGSVTFSALKGCNLDTDANGLLTCGTDATGGGGSGFGSGNVITIGDGRYVNQSGDTMTGALNLQNGTPNGIVLNARGTLSGKIIKATNSLSSSGSLTVEGTMSGATIGGAGLVDCDTGASSKLLWDATTGKFSCGTDQTSAGGMSLTRINGSSGAAGADTTWQNLTANSTDCTTTALCAAVMTTTGVGAGTWKFKYTIIYQTAATTTGIGFAINHTGTAGQYQAMWTHITTGGAAATGIGDSDTATAAGQLAEGKHEGALNALIGSTTAGVDAANTDIMAVLEGIIVVTASGDLELKIGSEVGSSAVRVMADSTLELLKIE